jgi:hypothetical protein
MVSELLMAALLLVPAISLTQKNNLVITPQQASPGRAAPATPPIKMGLWESTITNSVATNTIKTRSCMTLQSYQESIPHLPPGCTVTNKTQTATSITGDVSCTLQHGGTTSGHIDVEMPDPATVRFTIKLMVNAQGRSVPITLTTDSHFVSATCGDIAPGQAKIIQ